MFGGNSIRIFIALRNNFVAFSFITNNKSITQINSIILYKFVNIDSQTLNVLEVFLVPRLRKSVVFVEKKVEKCSIGIIGRIGWMWINLTTVISYIPFCNDGVILVNATNASTTTLLKQYDIYIYICRKCFLTHYYLGIEVPYDS